MRHLRTNTATRITVGPFFDKTDGVTPETGITVTSCKLTATVDDAGVPTLVLDTAPTASGGANDMVHITGDDAGYYDLELAAANVNYLGRFHLAITDAAVHCPVFHEFQIITASQYDALYATSGAIPHLGIIGSGTMQAGSAAGTAVLAAATSYANDIPNGSIIAITGGTGAGQTRLVDDWDNTTDTATVTPNWTTTPDNTSVYIWYAAPPGSTGAPSPVNVTQIAGSAVSTSTAQLGVNVVNAAGTAWGSGAITAASIASDAITAAKIAAGAIDAATFAADVDAEILSYIVDDATRIDASELNSKIDSLTFTQAGHVDANVQRINDVAITGDGSATPFNV